VHSVKGEIMTKELQGPLNGIRVIALEQVLAAPLCSRHLADLGADVIKIENPETGGDSSRKLDGVVNGLAGTFVWANRGKRSVALNVKDPKDFMMLEELLGTSDVFLHNLGPGSVDGLGLGWEQIHPRWPRLISCQISGYGTDGPYKDRKAYDLLLQGESGAIAVTGTPEHPAKVGISIADISAGMYAGWSIMAALIERAQTSEGRMIDISMLDCLTEWNMLPVYYSMYANLETPRVGMHHPVIVPYGLYSTGEGSVNLAVQNDSQWKRFCTEVCHHPEWVQDPRFSSIPLRVENRQLLEPMIEEALSIYDCKSAEEALDRADIPYGSINNIADVVAHSQHTARQRWFEVESENGPVTAFAPPFNILGMSRQEGKIPKLGEHTEQIRKGLDLI
jgi:itaconate CoA-transferase